jgi:hypothetical protein
MKTSMNLLQASKRGLIIMLAAVAAAGCSSHQRPLFTAINPGSWSDRTIDDEPRIFTGVGPLAVDVESFNGDVMIRGDEKLSEVTVQIVRESVHGYGRSGEGKESLADISWTAEIVAGELGQVLQVRATTANAEPHYQRAHVIIKAPTVDGVKVKTNKGRVEAEHIQGKVDISTNEADVRVMTTLPMMQAVTVVNRDGDIDYRVRGESAGTFDAQTIDGLVSHRIRKGKLIVLPPLAEDRFHAVFNDGRNLITLRTVDGDIRIVVVPNPEQVGELIF